MSKVDYLTEDTILPRDQKFICMSFLSDKDKKTSLSGIKLRGAFNTYEEACEHAKKLQSIDQYFNVFVGEMGKWLPFDPNPDSELVNDSQYANAELNTMMKSYIENQEKSKIFHEQRKQELVRQNIMENLQTRKDALQDLEKTFDTSTDKKSVKESMKTFEEQIKKMEDRKLELDKQIDDLAEQVKSFNVGPDNGPKIIDNYYEEHPHLPQN
jgi:DNA repair exonuclease SbcCD ATPase subunit